MGRTCCVQKLFWMSEITSVHYMFSPGLSLEFSCIELVSNSMNNLLSYCGSVDKIRASDKDLSVQSWICKRRYEVHARGQYLDWQSLDCFLLGFHLERGGAWSHFVLRTKTGGFLSMWKNCQRWNAHTYQLKSLKNQICKT